MEKMKHFWALLGFLGAFEAVSGCDRLGVLAWHGQNVQIAGESVPKPKKLNF